MLSRRAATLAAFSRFSNLRSHVTSTFQCKSSAMTCPTPEKFFPAVLSPALRDGSMRGKIALVTGGGTGIGKAIATQFAALGAKVAIAARRIDVLEKTAREIREQTGGVCEAFKLDVKNGALIAGVIDEIEAKLGGTPNILVNNAAGNFIMATERLSDNAIGTIVDIVLRGTLRVTTEVGRRCIERGSGCAVLCITAAYARSGASFVVPSAVSKAGVEIMCKSLATEWAKYGLRFNVISPGPVPTEGAFGRLSTDSYDETIKKMAHNIPTGRVGQPEEIANMAAFLCSDYANFINGAIIDMDGGQQYSRDSLDARALHELTPDDWKRTEELIRGRTNKSKI